MEEKETIFILSDSSKTNSKGFRISLSGGRFERFDSNPVMLYDHDTKYLIGCWKDRKVEDGKMTAKPVFDSKDDFAAEKSRKVTDGFLKGASIGIIPYKMQEIGDELVLTDWELVEASITPIPSDAGAVRLYNEKNEPISFEQFKLSFNNNNKTKTMEQKEITLTSATCQSLSLSSNATAKEIELAVAEKDSKIENLEKEIKKLHEAEIDSYLAQAVKDGKLDKEELADQRELALLNFDKVKSVIDRKPVTASASLKDMEKKTNLTAGDRADWDYLKWAKQDSKGLATLKAENPTEFERLKSEYENKRK